MAKSYVDDFFLRFYVFIQVHSLGFGAEMFRFLGFTASGVLRLLASVCTSFECGWVAAGMPRKKSWRITTSDEERE
jgi:hypothetical protein